MRVYRGGKWQEDLLQASREGEHWRGLTSVPARRTSYLPPAGPTCMQPLREL